MGLDAGLVRLLVNRLSSCPGPRFQKEKEKKKRKNREKKREKKRDKKKDSNYTFAERLIKLIKNSYHSLSKAFFISKSVYIDIFKKF